MQFVAYTRARVRLILLSHLETFNRQNILALWNQPFCRSEPPTQETMAAESEDDEEDQSRAEEAVFAALDLLGLQAVHGLGHTYLHYTVRTAPHRTAPLYAGTACR